MTQLNLAQTTKPTLLNTRIPGEDLTPRHEIETSRELWVEPHANLKELQGLGRARTRAARPLSDHCHGDILELVIMRSGTATYHVNGDRHDLTGGEVLVIPPNKSHGALNHSIPPCDQFWLLLELTPKTQKHFLGLPPDEGQPLQSHMRGLQGGAHAVSPLWFKRLDTLFDDLKSEHAPFKSLTARTLTIDLCIDLIQGQTQRPTSEAIGNNNMTNRCISLMQAHLALPLGLDDIADQLGVSTSHLKATFRRVKGVPPAEFYLRLRLDAALKDLADGKASITSVAFDYGFQSSQYFATCCKRILGRSPSGFRRQPPLMDAEMCQSVPVS